MAILFPATHDGLIRTTGLLQPTTDYTVAVWAQYTVLNTASQQIAVYFDSGGSPYMLIGSQPFVDTTQLESFSAALVLGSVIGPTLPLNLWTHLAGTYNHTTHLWSYYVNGQLLGTYTLDLSATTFTSAFLGDNGTHGYQPGVGVAYYREWQAVLTPAQIQAEMGSTAAVLTTGLFTDTPLTSATDLADASGNGHAWTASGTPTTVTGPTLTGNAAAWLPQPVPMTNPTTGLVSTPWMLYFENTRQQAAAGATVASGAVGGGGGTSGGPVRAVLGTAPVQSSGGSTPIISLAPSGVTAGTYGDATHVAQVTINTTGQVTAAVSVPITGGGGGTPGGSSGQVQYNNAGAFGGISGGTSGYVLTSTGPSTAPTFQPAAGGGGSSWVPLSLGVDQTYGNYLVASGMTQVPPQGLVHVSDGAGQTIFVAFS